MFYCRITPAKIHVRSHKHLRAAWRLYKADFLVGTYVCESTLTPSQRRRLPKGLRDRLVEVPE